MSPSEKEYIEAKYKKRLDLLELYVTCTRCDIIFFDGSKTCIYCGEGTEKCGHDYL